MTLFVVLASRRSRVIRNTCKRPVIITKLGTKEKKIHTFERELVVKLKTLSNSWEGFFLSPEAFVLILELFLPSDPNMVVNLFILLMQY